MSCSSHVTPGMLSDHVTDATRFTEYNNSWLSHRIVVSPMLLRMRESESGTLPRTKVWYGAKPNNRVSQQTQAKS